MNTPTPLSNNRLHIVFRLDAGTPFGNGHLMRSMVLGLELLGQGHKVVFLAQQVPESLQSMLRAKGITVLHIAPQSDGISELAQLNKADCINWLVIDHYGIDVHWESAARPYVANIMVIDDLANREHDCDLLLDQNIPNQLQKLYANLVPKNCLQIIGWSYLLARPEFYVLDSQDKSGTLVFLGGGNHSEALSVMIKSLLQKTELHPLKVLVSSDYLPISHWQKLIGDCGQVYCDLPNPAPLYQSSKLAIVRCGFASYELALVGTPAVHLYTTDVQFEVAHALEHLGLGIALAAKNLTNAEKIIDVMHRAATMKPIPVNEKLSPGAAKVTNLLEHFHEYR